MKVEKNILFVAVGILGGLLFLGAGAMLFVGVRQLTEAENKLQSLKSARTEFFQRNPFPSEDNIRRERENGEVLDGWYTNLIQTMANHQVLPDMKKSPSTFISLLGETKNRLVALADQSVVVIPKDFGMGFERYFARGSALPAPADVPTLTQQLLVMEDLFKVLVECNVKEVLSTQREVFEVAAEAVSVRRRGARGQSLPEEPAELPGEVAAVAAKPGSIEGDSLYGILHFTLSFRAKETAFFQVMNRLAGHPMVAVVTDVTTEDDGPNLVRQSAEDGKASRAGAREAAALVPEESELPAEAPKKKEYIPRLERQVSGAPKAQPLKVTVGVDVYVFRVD